MPFFVDFRFFAKRSIKKNFGCIGLPLSIRKKKIVQGILPVISCIDQDDRYKFFENQDIVLVFASKDDVLLDIFTNAYPEKNFSCVNDEVLQRSYESFLEDEDFSLCNVAEFCSSPSPQLVFRQPEGKIQVFLGDVFDANRTDDLIDLGVTAILNVTKDHQGNSSDQFNHMRIPIDDRPEEIILCHLQNAFVFIERHKSVLVHCAAGISRSASIVIAYVMWKEGKCFEEAFDAVRKHRKIIDPNFGFCCQLKHEEKTIQNIKLV